MSGVELAGLILAIIPLVVSSLEHYNEGLDPVRAFMNRDRLMPALIRNLRNQHVFFEQTLRLLLSPLTANDELAEMIAAPNGHLWKDERIAVELRQRLGEAYVPYLETMGEIRRIMEKIAEKLDIDRASEVTRDDLQAILIANPAKTSIKGDSSKFEFSKRVKFSMSRKKVKSLLEQLEACNRELERFTDRSEKLEPYRQEKKPSFAKKILRIQNYAKDLHHVLVDSWSCSCPNSHTTSLRLEQRLVTRSSLARGLSSDSGTDEAKFTVFFTGTTPSWSLQEAEVKMVLKEDDVLVIKRPAFSELKSPRTVSFQGPPSPSLSRTPTLVPLDPRRSQDEIKDICSTIQEYSDDSQCLGFDLDDTGILRGAYAIASQTSYPSSKSRGTMVSLAQLLSAVPTRLSMKDRYLLAVTLASSTLQLFTTPWIQDHWSKEDIVFYQTNDSSSRIMADVHHPFVRCTPSREPIPLNELKISSTFRNKNTILLALAITLLELYFGQSRETRQELQCLPDPLGPHGFNPWALCTIAYHWAESEEGNLSAAFSSAVGYCLRSFGDPGSNLQDPAALESAVEGILLPLQDELLHFMGKKAG